MNHNLYERVNRLESLIFEDEEIVSHGRVRSPKPNLFSKKIEEVKLAVERGDDLNSTDRYNRTPLQAACAQKEINVELIEYLLDNGADPNITDKKGVPYLTVFAKGCKTDLSLNRRLLELFIEHGVSLKDGEYCDIPVLLWAMYNGIKDEFLLSLIDDSVIRNRTPVNCFDIIGKVVEHYAWSSGNRLNENLYSAIVNKFVALMNSNNKLHDFFNTRSSESSDNIIATEIALKGTSYLFDAIMKYNIWPFVMCQIYGVGCLNDKLKNKLYYEAQRVTGGSYYIYKIDGFVTDVLWAGSGLNKPVDFIADAITPETIKQSVTNLDTLYSLMYKSLQNHNNKLLRSLIEGSRDLIKNKDANGSGRNDLIKFVAKSSPSSWLDEATRLVCKVLNILPDSDAIVIKRDGWSIGYELGTTHNVRLINWFIHNGYGKDIENSVSKHEVSDEVKAALEEDESTERASKILADIDSKRNEHTRLYQAKSMLQQDRYVRDISTIVDQYPEFLTDTEFYNMAKELSSSSTNARLLVRYIDDYKRNHKNDIVGDIYDM